MLKRYEGKDGRGALLSALRDQFLIDGNSDIADKMASGSQLAEYAPGTILFTQGERGGDLCLVLAGKVSVRVDEQEVATCGAGIHVGEIGLLEPFKGRSATVAAIDTVVAANISHTRFTEIARLHPELWRRVAVELAHRLVKSQARG